MLDLSCLSASQLKALASDCSLGRQALFFRTFDDRAIAVVSCGKGQVLGSNYTPLETKTHIYVPTIAHAFSCIWELRQLLGWK